MSFLSRWRNLTARTRLSDPAVVLATRGIIEALEKRSLLSVSPPAGFELVTAFDVDATAEVHEIRPDLKLSSSEQYFFIASGQHQLAINPLRYADAQKYQNLSGAWVSGSNPHLRVNNVNWWAAAPEADFDATGQRYYSKLVYGDNKALDAWVNDSNYGDNIGFLSLQVFARKPVVTILPAATGGVSVPEGSSGAAFVVKRTGLGPLDVRLKLDEMVGQADLARLGDDFDLLVDGTPVSLEDSVFTVGFTDSEPKTITLVAKKDRIVEVSERVRLSVYGDYQSGPDDPAQYTIGTPSSAEAVITNGNAAPEIETADSDPMAVNGTIVVGINEPVTFTGVFSDPDYEDAWAITIDSGDGVGTVAGDIYAADMTYSATRAFSETGVFTVTLTLTDLAGATDTVSTVVEVTHLKSLTVSDADFSMRSVTAETRDADDTLYIGLKRDGNAKISFGAEVVGNEAGSPVLWVLEGFRSSPNHGVLQAENLSVLDPHASNVNMKYILSVGIDSNRDGELQYGDNGEASEVLRHVNIIVVRVDNLFATDAADASDTITAASEEDRPTLYLRPPNTGDSTGSFRLSILGKPMSSEARSQVRWRVRSSSTSSSVPAQLQEGEFGGQDPAITVTPHDENTYAYWAEAGFDHNANGHLEDAEVVRTAAIEVRAFDFIALSALSVNSANVSVGNHYGVTYWTSDFPVTNLREYTAAEMHATKAVWINGTEVTPRPYEWNVWNWVPSGPLQDGYWSISEGRKVSIVYFKAYSNERYMPIYVDTAPSKVLEKWNTILSTATTYPYGEQFSGNSNAPVSAFANWSNSSYSMWHNNSNTFARYVVRKSGLTMHEMSGSFPGNEWPVDRDPMFDYFYGQTPWLSTATAKPMPDFNPEQ